MGLVNFICVIILIFYFLLTKEAEEKNQELERELKSQKGR